MRYGGNKNYSKKQSLITIVNYTGKTTKILSRLLYAVLKTLPALIIVFVLFYLFIFVRSALDVKYIVHTATMPSDLSNDGYDGNYVTTEALRILPKLNNEKIKLARRTPFGSENDVSGCFPFSSLPTEILSAYISVMEKQSAELADRFEVDFSPYPLNSEIISRLQNLLGYSSYKIRLAVLNADEAIKVRGSIENATGESTTVERQATDKQSVARTAADVVYDLINPAYRAYQRDPSSEISFETDLYHAKDVMNDPQMELLVRLRQMSTAIEDTGIDAPLKINAAYDNVEKVRTFVEENPETKPEINNYALILADIVELRWYQFMEVWFSLNDEMVESRSLLQSFALEEWPEIYNEGNGVDVYYYSVLLYLLGKEDDALNALEEANKNKWDMVIRDHDDRLRLRAAAILTYRQLGRADLVQKQVQAVKYEDPYYLNTVQLPAQEWFDGVEAAVSWELGDKEAFRHWLKDAANISPCVVLNGIDQVLEVTARNEAANIEQQDIEVITSILASISDKFESNANILDRMASLYRRLGKLDEAKLTYSRLRAHATPSAWTHLNEGVLDLVRGDPGAAEKAFKASLQITPVNRAIGGYLLSLALQQQYRKFKMEYVRFRNLITEDPENFDGYMIPVIGTAICSSGNLPLVDGEVWVAQGTKRKFDANLCPPSTLLPKDIQ